MNVKSPLANFIGLLLSCYLACYAQNPPETEPSSVVATVPEALAPNTVIPLIVFQEASLITALENLARQAGLNYILDPKLPYNQPDAAGKIAPPPIISVRWVNLTSEQALAALLETHTLQLVENPKTKVTTIKAKDPAALEPLTNCVIQLKYAGVTNIIASLQGALSDKRSKIVGDPRTSQLVVVATEKELVGVFELLMHLDIPTKQVLIEAKIMETSVNPKTVKGIDWTSTLSSQNVTFGNGRTTGNTTTTLPGTPTTTTLPGGRTVTTTPASSSQTTLNTVLGGSGLGLNTLSGFNPTTAFLNADGLNVAISFLNSSGETKVISEPRTVTLDNQKATIDVGLLYPIVNTSAGTANTAGGSQTSYSNLTVNLDVTPRITANSFVELKVKQSILRLGPQFRSIVGGVANDVPSFFTRNLETSVLIPSGNTLVMGGLVSDEGITGNTKVPILGDIPGLGWAFRHDSKERNRQNLIVFITPTIVQTNDFQAAATQFLKSRPTPFQADLNNLSPWDSAKPKDWSNPQATPYNEAVFDESAVQPKPEPTQP